MSQFANSKRLCCWAGLSPGNNEYAGKQKQKAIKQATKLLISQVIIKASDISVA
jgi:hypothetical protein